MERQLSLEPALITQHRVLAPGECETIRDQVFGLREYWTRRGEGGGFFTLGAAAYLDAPEKRDAYLHSGRKVNPLLRENFDWLYERVRAGFQDLLEETVSYDTGYPLPGFHIFRYEGPDHHNDKPSDRAHFDLQWMLAMPSSRPKETLSFTLSIEEPTGGSSLEVWPKHYSAVRPDFDVRQYTVNCPSHTVAYSRGHMIVHDGLLLHAIGMPSEGYRMTFQGHGVRFAHGWNLYW